MSSDGWDDDEKTVLSWLDSDPGEPALKAKETGKDGGAALPPEPQAEASSETKPENPDAEDGEHTVFGAALPVTAPPPAMEASKAAPAEKVDEWTMSAPLPMPGSTIAPPSGAGDTAAPRRGAEPVAEEPEERTVLQPLPMPGATPSHDVPQSPATPEEDADQRAPPETPREISPETQPGTQAGAQTEADEDDRTVIGAPLDWFDPPTMPPQAVEKAAADSFDEDPAPVPAPVPAPDEDKTVIAPLPSFAAMPDSLRPKTATAIQRFVPRDLWSPQEKTEQALLGHGLEQALRRATRRAPKGLTPAARDALLRDATERLRHPTDAFLDDALLETFRELVVTRVDDLAMEELDFEPEMPPGLDPLEQQEWRALGKGLFVLLRELERRAGGKPRIGRNTRLHDRVVKLGQDPFLGMPHAEVARYDPSQRIPVVRAQFMGFFGPHGAFPLNWTEEVHRWFRAGDASFVAFVDIFTARFQELFFRAWSDARAITQFDHAEGDRFEAYMLSFTGNGTPAMQGRDALSDTVKARYAGLSGGRVKSPTRLRQMLQLHFDGKLRVEIEELVPTWLDFEPDTLSKLGMQACGMGMNMHLGSRVRSVGEKIRVHLYVHSITHYFDLLPGGHDHGHLRDLVHWYLGEAYETEVVIWLPQTEIQPAVMGVSAQLGWMACLSPPKGDPDVMVQVTVFKLLPPKGDQREAA